jgi:hypothetical protein
MNSQGNTKHKREMLEVSLPDFKLYYRTMAIKKKHGTITKTDMKISRTE